MLTVNNNDMNFGAQNSGSMLWEWQGSEGLQVGVGEG